MTGNRSEALPIGSRAELAAVIDHTLLDPAADARAVEAACARVLEHGFATVCLAPVWIARAASILRGSASGVCSVVGFPSGAHRTEIKAHEARQAIADGARELDVVIALGALKSGDLAAVRRDLEGVVEAARGGALVKAILETGRLTDDEKRQAARMAAEAGAAFVKTSTGFGGGGATPDDVRLLHATVGDRCRVKASGGIRTTLQAIELLRAGASRLGTSVGPALLAGLTNTEA